MRRNVNGRLAAGLVAAACIGLLFVAFTSVGGSIAPRPDAVAQKSAVVVRAAQAMNALGFVAALNALREAETAAAPASTADKTTLVKHAFFLEDYVEGGKGAVVVSGELRLDKAIPGRFTSVDYQAECLSRVEIMDPGSGCVFALERGQVFPLVASGAYRAAGAEPGLAAMQVGCRLAELRGRISGADELWSGLTPTAAAVSAYLDSTIVYEEGPAGKTPSLAHAMQGRFELDLWRGLENARMGIDIQPGRLDKRVELTLNGKPQGRYTLAEFAEEFDARLGSDLKTVDTVRPPIPPAGAPVTPPLREADAPGYGLCAFLV